MVNHFHLVPRHDIFVVQVVHFRPHRHYGVLVLLGKPTYLPVGLLLELLKVSHHVLVLGKRNLAPLHVGKSLLVILFDEVLVLLCLSIRCLKEVFVLDLAVSHEHLQLLNALVVVFKLSLVNLFSLRSVKQVAIAVHVFVLGQLIRLLL